MRVLHVVKTSDGAVWAAHQAAQLVSMGVEVHVVLPNREGRHVKDWRDAGVTMHYMDLSCPLDKPWQVFQRMKSAQGLVARLKPSLIHSHFVSTTLLLRFALGRRHKIPRVFQVPGPLHLENPVVRRLEIESAGTADYWIASSRYTMDLYGRAGADPSKVFLSYYGAKRNEATHLPNGFFRRMLSLPEEAYLVGNVSYMYPPKYWLGQRFGIKGHEMLIEALDLVCRKDKYAFGVLAGSSFARHSNYENKLREAAARKGHGRIFMPGHIETADIGSAWADLDCAVHCPLSENCGGVVEPLRYGVPVVAAAVGGIPEVVIDSITGRTIASCKAETLAREVMAVKENRIERQRLARNGQALVEQMFSVRRTAQEIMEIYEYILGSRSVRPLCYDSQIVALSNVEKQSEA